jgi:serine/threonine protein kinase
MGEDFKARHPLLKRTLAVKVLRPDRLAAGTVQRFLREIEAAGQLSHPNIVMAHDAAQVGDTFLLVMEYVEGRDLARWVQEGGSLPVARACDFIRQAALGLQHAHERGLVHRDVKPSNLLVTDREGVVKVADLGLARLRQPDAAGALHGTWTQEGAVMGTPHYLAPEQARDARRADTRADVYSLGCTFYHLLTGRPPFAGQSLAELVLRHAGDEAEPVERLRPEVPAEVAAVVRRMMAKRPEDRPQSAAEVAQALAGPASAAGPPSPPQAFATTLDFPPARGRPARGRARKRLLAAGAALAVLTALALA